MTSASRNTRLLGAAFLLQAVTSLVSGAILLDPLIADGNAPETLANIAGSAPVFRTGLLLDLVTAMGIVFLGAVLFETVRKQGQATALIALGLYILEAALLAASRLAGFALLPASEAYAAAGDPTQLEALGHLALETMQFGFQLHMLCFSVGAMLFYYLLYKSAVIPRLLALWGLVTVPLMLVLTLLAIFGYELSIVFYLPYAPFEFVAGIWILIKGIRVDEESQ
jgi:hypothetical protein